MRKKLLVMAAAILLPGMAVAGGDAAAGKAAAGMCAGCHGPDGKALNPAYPNLAGQNAAYLEAALKAYRAGQRAGANAAIMQPMAANLSDDDIANLAAYFSSL